MEKFFMTQIKRTNGTFEKGCVVRDTYDEVEQAYHAYLGAYAFDHDANTDYVQCSISNIDGVVLEGKVWNHLPSEEPEPVNA